MTTKIKNLNKTELISTDKYTVLKLTGETEFGGCQCMKDCTCNNDFISYNFLQYKVIRVTKKGKRVTTYHETKDEMIDRVKYLEFNT